MTDDTFDPRDELASAHLDGETAPEEADQAADPAIRARMTELAAVREAVRAEDDRPVDADRREAAIAAALSAYDAAAEDNVTPITAARRARPRWAPAVGVAAAAVAAAALLVPLLTSGDDGEDTQTAARDETTTLAPPDARGADEADDDPSLDATMAAPEGGNELTTADASLPHLGAQADVEALADVVRELLVSPPTTEPGTSTLQVAPETDACVVGFRESLGVAGSGAVLSGAATIDGQEVGWVVEEELDSRRVLHVLDPADGCTPVAQVVL